MFSTHEFILNNQKSSETVIENNYKLIKQFIELSVEMNDFKKEDIEIYNILLEQYKPSFTPDAFLSTDNIIENIKNILIDSLNETSDYNLNLNLNIDNYSNIIDKIYNIQTVYFKDINDVKLFTSNVEFNISLKEMLDIHNNLMLNNNFTAWKSYKWISLYIEYSTKIYNFSDNDLLTYKNIINTISL